MIYIYCDFERFDSIEPGEYTFVADRTSDYIPLRQRLRRALDDEDHDFTVYLRSPVLAEWLRDLRAYGERVVLWQGVDLHRRFQSRFGFQAPAELTASAIQELGMLSLPSPGYAAAADPVGWLLGQYLGPVWETVEPYPEHVADLAGWAANAGEVHSALRSLADKRLNRWLQTDSRYAYFLRHDWRDAGQKVLLQWALRSYPSSFRDSLGLAGAPDVDAARHAQACMPLLETHKSAVRRYWNLFFSKTSGSLSEIVEQALSQMSGLAQSELQGLSAYVGSRSSELTFALLDRLRAHFPLLPGSQSMSARLERLVPTPLPAEPGDSWKVSDWLRWSIDDYFPYFAWVVRNKQPRQEQTRLAGRFGDWFISDYARLLFDPCSPLLVNQHGYVRQFAQDAPESAVFWAIIDGLTWWQGKLLVGLCQERGLHVHKMEPALSTLPSITSVAKRALARGFLGTSERQSIAMVLQERLAQVYNRVAVFSEPSELTAALGTAVQPGAYVLLYNALDTHNHESSTFTDDESSLGYLRAVANALSEAVEQVTRQGLEACVLISSDHGSTLLPKEAAKLEPPAFIHELDDEDERLEVSTHKRSDLQRIRTCNVTRDVTAEETALLAKKWYVLDKTKFGLAETLLIPKGYAFVRRRPRGWIHGSATPEEVVVPFIEMRPQPLELWTPELRFEGYLLPARPSTITVTLINPNPFPLNQVHLSAWEGTLSATLSVLAGSERAQINVPIPSTSASGQEVTFDWRLVCKVAEGPREFTGQGTLPIRRLQVSQVDELFKELQ
jgi:hypothetical protein